MLVYQKEFNKNVFGQKGEIRDGGEIKESGINC